MPIRFLSLERVLFMHQDLTQDFGGDAGVRDLGLLQSALAMPSAGMGGEYFHSDLFEMAAAYLFHIVKNHPFVDGNKRVGTAAALAFLEFNGVDVDVSNDRLVDLVLSVAEGKTPKRAIAEFFRKHGRRA